LKGNGKTDLIAKTEDLALEPLLQETSEIDWSDVLAAFQRVGA